MDSFIFLHDRTDVHVHVYRLIYASGGGGDGQARDHCSRPSYFCVSTFVSVTVLDIFKETLGQSQALFEATKTAYF